MKSLRAITLLSRIFGQQLLFSIRFIPSEQSRLDRRGRTVGEYESLADALSAFKSLERDASARKEHVHGHYYLSVEARSGEIHHAGRVIPGSHQADIEEEIRRESAKAGGGDFSATQSGAVLQRVSQAPAERSETAGAGTGPQVEQGGTSGAGESPAGVSEGQQQEAGFGQGRVKLADLGRRE